MKRLLILIMVGIIGLFIIGCAGKNFTWQNAATVSLGDSGDQVIEKMQGRPYNITASKIDGKVIEKYIWSFANGITGSSKVVSFVLTDGKVTSIPTITKSIMEQ